jgi:phage terminase small subunit
VSAAPSPPRPPAALGTSGRRLWRAIVKDYDLAAHELELLRQACRTLDVLDQLDAVTDAEGAVVDSPQGRKANPSVVEARQHRLAFGRLLAALGIPADADEAAGAESGAASRQRSGSAPFRGLYSLGGGAS